MAKDTKNTSWTTLLRAVPEPLRSMLDSVDEDISGSATELRIRMNGNLEIMLGRRSVWLDERLGFVADRDYCERLLEAFTSHSIYSVEKRMRECYIPLQGGIRVGIAGHGRGEDNASMIMPATSFCIRLPHEVRGAAEKIENLVKAGGGYLSTLVISPPGCGKTTLLRDFARCMSDDGRHVAIADERGEISGMTDGVIPFDIGKRSDVIEGMDKTKAIIFAIRSLSPDVVVTDEIGGEEDAGILSEAAKCGVAVFASAHAGDLREAMERPTLCEAIKSFERVVLLSSREGPGTIDGVYGRARDGWARMWRRA